MSVRDPYPLAFIDPFAFLILIAYVVGSSLHQCADIHLICEHFSNRRLRPQSICATCFGFAVDILWTLLPLVFRWTGNSVIVKLSDYPAVSFTADIHFKYPPYDRSSFAVYYQAMLVIGVYLIAVRCKRAYELPLLSFVCESAAYLAWNILDVHLVVRTCEKPHCTVAFALCVGIVRDPDKPYPPFEKFIIYELLDNYSIARKSRLIFAQHDINVPFFAVTEQASKLGAAAVTAVTVIYVNVVYLPVALAAVITEHGFLILYTCAGVAFRLVPVLDRQAAVYPHLRHWPHSSLFEPCYPACFARIFTSFSILAVTASFNCSALSDLKLLLTWIVPFILSPTCFFEWYAWDWNYMPALYLEWGIKILNKLWFISGVSHFVPPTWKNGVYMLYFTTEKYV